MTDEQTETIEPVDTAATFDSFTETWAPRQIAAPNDHAVKLARLDGEFVWHSHPDADEVFWVVDGGPLTIRLRDRDPVELDPGELVVVPSGVEHKPVAPTETKVALIEPADTRNTGDAGGERTRDPVDLTGENEQTTENGSGDTNTTENGSDDTNTTEDGSGDTNTTG